MPPTIYSFDEFVERFITAWAMQLNLEPNLPVGNALRAIAECDSSQALTLENMAQETIAFARALTCSGPDLDSFFAQFNFPRLPAVTASGNVTFSASAPTNQKIIIPIGTVVATPGGAISYQVIADNSLPGYDSSINAYVVAVGEESVAVAMQAIIAGAIYNVQANQLTVLQSTIFNIQSVANVGAIINGKNAETDDAYRARFIEYLNSLSQATRTAILRAVLGLQAGLKVAMIENQQAIGNPPTSLIDPYYGNIITLVDDGTGNPSPALINAATVAVASTRAWGIQYQVLPPAIVEPNVLLTIKVGPHGTPAQVATNVQQAIFDYINGLQIGDTVYLENIVAIAKDADENIIAVAASSTTINGVQADLVLQPFEEAVIQIDDIAVNTI